MMPKEEISFELFGKTRTLKTPTNGMLDKLERNKIQYSDDTHKKMLYGGTREALYTWVQVEAKLTIDAFLPSLKEELKVTSLNNLNLVQTKEMVTAYRLHLKPWLDEIYNFLNDVEEELSEVESK